nr:RNA polymerase II-associated protein 1 isoform X2 [Parasteatoda tepidariorum]
MEDVKRPTCAESDEDLLKQQEEFFKKKAKSCVNLKKPPEFSSKSFELEGVSDKKTNLDVHHEKVISDVKDLKRSSMNEHEDLLKQQKDFLKNKMEPSVCLKKRAKSEVKQSENVSISSENKSDIPEKPVLVVHQEEFIFDVQERPLSNEPFVFQLPSVSPEDIFNTLEKKSSLSKFAAKRKEQHNYSKEIASKEQNLSKPTSSFNSTTENTVDVKAIKMEVDKENQGIISAMSPEEIKKKVEQIKSQYDPKLLKFLQNKGKHKNISEGHTGTLNSTPALKKFFVQQSTSDHDVNCDEVLREEGNAECDGLILERALKDTVIPESSGIIENFKNKDIEIPGATQKILAESNKGKWQNMNKIEKEKLEWISDLPKPNPLYLKTGYTARFDFMGKLLAYDTDIPVHKGLHHHGKEPEIAGYSLEELFLLARSSLQSQRITAFHTLAHILDNYWYGMFDSCFDNPLLPTLLDAGIVPLLRWALDDVTVTSVAATITAIHSLLISKPDEACLMKTFCWLNGSLLPHLEPTDLEETNIVMEELTDADLIKLDVIKGFLRMDILPRFYYILQELPPPPLVCKLVMEICGHLAQHSKESSDQVALYQPLMKLIFQKFLPLSWHFIDGSKLTDSANYCCPMSSAMKLMRILSSASKVNASYLIEKYELEKILTLYLSLSPNDGKMASLEVQNVMIETLKTLHTLLRYGYGFQVYFDLYSIFLRQMKFCLSLNLNSNEKEHCQDFEYASHLFKMFEAITIIITEQSDCFHRKKEVGIIFNQALVCLEKWLYQVKQEKPTDRALTLLASAMNFVSMYYKKSHKGLICDDWMPCSAVKDMFNNFLLPCLHSKVFKNLLDQIESCSLLLSTYESGNKRDGKTLVSLGSVLWEGDVVPLLKEGSPIPLLLSIFNFILIHRNLSDDNDNRLYEEVYNTILMEYLQKLNLSKLNICTWFVRHESHLITLLLQLITSVPHKCLELHKTAISLLPTLRISDECLIEDLFENIIFNEKFLPSSNVAGVQNIVSILPVIARCYISYFLDEKCVVHSRNLYFGSIELDTLSCISNPKCILPHDWFYAPIFDLYHDTSKRKSNESLAPEDVLLITGCLQWILLSRKMSLSFLKSIPASEEFCYFSMVFLLDEDYFQNPKIKPLHEANFIELLKDRGIIELSQLNCSNISSFDDFYLDLLNQFEAVSYGDHLFGNCILFPIQQCYPNKWRKILLTDHSHAIPFLRVPLSKLLVPVKSYLEPCELNAEILREYLKLILNGTLTHQRCPLLYLMAIHHIHNFIFMENEKFQKPQKLIIKNIALTRNEIVKRHILLYHDVDITSEFGFCLKEELTHNETQHLYKILGQTIKL